MEPKESSNGLREKLASSFSTIHNGGGKDLVGVRGPIDPNNVSLSSESVTRDASCKIRVVIKDVVYTKGCIIHILDGANGFILRGNRVEQIEGASEQEKLTTNDVQAYSGTNDTRTPIPQKGLPQRPCPGRCRQSNREGFHIT